MGNNSFTGVTSKLSGVTSKLSGVASSLTTGFLSDPRRLESILGLVRTAAPLTSAQTVSKINTYLPIVEKLSTLLGMYAFLSRAQNFTPIQSLGDKSPIEKVSALVSNGSIPIGKILSQPLIANNMDKIISSVAKNVIGPSFNIGGGLEQMLASVAKQFVNSSSSEGDSASSTEGESSGIDLGSLIDTFMPLLSSLTSSDTPPARDDNTRDDQDIDNTYKVVEPTHDDPTIHDDGSKNYSEIKSSSNTNLDYDSQVPLEIKRRRSRRRFS